MSTTTGARQRAVAGVTEAGVTEAGVTEAGVTAEGIATMRPTRPMSVAVTVAMVLGAALVAGSGVIHLHLWMTGYRNIHIIGPLFMAQAISAYVIALGVVVTRWALAAVAGAAFLLGTIGGLLMSNYYGLFGFRDSFSAPFAGVSLFVEGAGVVILAAAALGRYQLRRTR